MPGAKHLLNLSQCLSMLFNKGFYEIKTDLFWAGDQIVTVKENGEENKLSMDIQASVASNLKPGSMGPGYQQHNIKTNLKHSDP